MEDLYGKGSAPREQFLQATRARDSVSSSVLAVCHTGVMTAVLITAGPTREHLDDVRFLSNASSGRMGYALAAAAQRAGHDVVLVSGPTHLPAPRGVRTEHVVSALEMQAAVQRCLEQDALVFGVAAVVDARPRQRWPGKPPKDAVKGPIELVPNPDIIAGVADAGRARAVVGFALQAEGDGGLEAALARGRQKMQQKRLDAIAVNTAAALGADRSEVWVLRADGGEERLPPQSKDLTAARLCELGIEIWQAKR